MSWIYNRRKRSKKGAGRTRVQSKASSQARDKSLTYVKQRFFSFNEDVFERFTEFYQEKYGKGATKYLLKTYPLWRSGSTGMSGQSDKRILLCVPRFLEPEEQFKLLSFQIPKILKQITGAWHSREMEVSEFKNSYEKFANQVCNRTYSLDWFVAETFSEDELEELVLALKYTILDCLHRSYNRVGSDLEVFEGLARRIWGLRSAWYEVDVFDCRLSLNSAITPRLPAFDIGVPEPSFVSQFQIHYRDLLVEHVFTQLRQEYIGSANQKLLSSDVEALCSSLDASLSNQEVDLKLDMDGKGGTLSLHFVRRDIDRLRYELLLEKLKLCVSVGVLIITLIYFRDPRFLSTLILLCWVPLIFLGCMFSNIDTLAKEISDAERERRTWFTEA